jgi:hypothetical protein
VDSLSISALILTIFTLSLPPLLGMGEYSPTDGMNNDETDKKHQPRDVPQILARLPRCARSFGDQRSLYAGRLREER